MSLTGRSSLERTNGRPLCPQCRAPMWSVRFPPEKAADDKIIFSVRVVREGTNLTLRQLADRPKSASRCILKDRRSQVS